MKPIVFNQYRKPVESEERRIALYRGVMRIALDMIDRENYGYEMDCLISAFTCLFK